MNNINNLIPFQRILIPEEVTHADWSKIVESIKTVSATTEQKELLNQSIDDLIYVHSIIKNSVPNEYTN